MNKSQALSILEKVLAASDADAVVAGLNGGGSATTRLADNLITQNFESYRAGLTVNCAYGQSHGTASTEDLSDESVKAVVASAQAIAKSMPPDPEYMPPVEAAETATYAKVDGYHEQTAQFSPNDRASQIAAVAQAVAGKGYGVAFSDQ